MNKYIFLVVVALNETVMESYAEPFDGSGNLLSYKENEISVKIEPIAKL